jgi:transposase
MTTKASMIKRWNARRKAAVLAAITTGKLSTDEALRRYDLSSEELVEWQRAFEAHGTCGLRATRVQFNHGKSARFRR